MRDGYMFVEGNLLTPPVFHLAEAAHQSSRIVRQVKPRLVQDTKGGLYAVEGGLWFRESSCPGFCPLELTPWLILDRFSEGFPSNWTELGRNWVVDMERHMEGAGGLRHSNSCTGDWICQEVSLQNPGKIGGIQMLHIRRLL